MAKPQQRKTKKRIKGGSKSKRQALWKHHRALLIGLVLVFGVVCFGLGAVLFSIFGKVPQPELEQEAKLGDETAGMSAEMEALVERSLSELQSTELKPTTEAPLEYPSKVQTKPERDFSLPPLPPQVPSRNLPKPEQSASFLPLWQKNSQTSALVSSQPAIAIILDDVGVAKAHAELAIDLPPSITLAFMTYANGVDAMARRARAKGHELLVHFPMEPLDSHLNPGPNALLVGLNEAEIKRRLAWGLSQFDGYIGLNNHMGSRFTENPQGMRFVLEELKKRGLLFLDSKTSAKSVGGDLAARMAIEHVTRDVFLDNEISTSKVAEQLQEAEKIALAKGDAIAIGHPHPETIAAIKAWMAGAERRGIKIVPLSAIARRRLGLAG